MYRIVFTNRALKDLEKIDKETQIRIATIANYLNKSPFKCGGR